MNEEAMRSAQAVDPKKRFSDRVADYKKHRPEYPVKIIDILQAEGALRPQTSIADVGSGTGMLCKLFFPYVEKVYGVEPNDAMRRQAEFDFADNPRFKSVNGSAEETPLPNDSVHLITVGQAFHWFDRQKTRIEFRRILKPGGFVLLVWNQRDLDADDLQRHYDELLRRHIPDYKQIDHRTITDDILFEFYGSRDIQKFNFPNEQLFDLDALKGRLLSSSYVPKPPHPILGKLLPELEQLFYNYQHNGRIRFIYKTQIYLGQLNESL